MRIDSDSLVFENDSFILCRGKYKHNMFKDIF